MTPLGKESTTGVELSLEEPLSLVCSLEEASPALSEALVEEALFGPHPVKMSDEAKAKTNKFFFMVNPPD